MELNVQRRGLFTQCGLLSPLTMQLFLLDLQKPQSLQQISRGQGGAVSSPTFGTQGKLAWLEQRDDGNARGRRHLWLTDDESAWEVPLLDFDLSPLRVLVGTTREFSN
jgi:hypothetical protein